MTLTVLNHPLLADRLTRMRDKTTPMVEFHRLLEECGRLMAYPLLQAMATRDAPVETPLAPFAGRRVVPPVLIGILRAALPMLSGVHAAIPESPIGHLGLYRDHETLQPVEYLIRLPVLEGRDIVLMDPMLATGGSIVHALNVLAQHGADINRVSVLGLLAAPEGIKKIESHAPQLPIFVAALDERLNEKGYIMPGLGDAGDRAFGTA